jgi:biopolymer transport protein ExbD
MSDQIWNEPRAEEEVPAWRDQHDQSCASVPVGARLVDPCHRRRMQHSAEMDITPMIDITFLLLIFFLVASTADPTKAVNLPPARHGAAVNPRTSVIITVAEGEPQGPARVYLGDGKSGAPLPDDPATQDALITRAVRAGLAEGRSTVLIKAERGVKHREVSRVATAAAEVEGIRLYLGVLEVE